jgi:NO-binding membrane sensor protein with MHYT domain
MHIQGFPQVGFDFRLVALSGLALIAATYATLALAERIKSSQGGAWFAWLGGSASTMGIGIWSMHYIGLKAFDLPVPTLNNPAVPISILTAIFASGITLLVVSGKSDSGRHVKAKNQRSATAEGRWKTRTVDCLLAALTFNPLLYLELDTDAEC